MPYKRKRVSSGRYVSKRRRIAAPRYRRVRMSPRYRSYRRSGRRRRVYGFRRRQSRLFTRNSLRRVKQWQARYIFQSNDLHTKGSYHGGYLLINSLAYNQVNGDILTRGAGVIPANASLRTDTPFYNWKITDSATDLNSVPRMCSYVYPMTTSVKVVMSFRQRTDMTVRISVLKPNFSAQSTASNPVHNFLSYDPEVSFNRTQFRVLKSRLYRLRDPFTRHVYGNVSGTLNDGSGTISTAPVEQILNHGRTRKTFYYTHRHKGKVSTNDGQVFHVEDIINATASTVAVPWNQRPDTDMYLVFEADNYDNDVDFDVTLTRRFNFGPMEVPSGTLGSFI